MTSLKHKPLFKITILININIFLDILYIIDIEKNYLTLQNYTIFLKKKKNKK